MIRVAMALIRRLVAEVYHIGRWECSAVTAGIYCPLHLKTPFVPLPVRDKMGARWSSSSPVKISRWRLALPTCSRIEQTSSALILWQ